jgi:hypothetical protein
MVGYGARIVDSTISGNSTLRDDSPGGGVFVWAYVEVEQSTISQNNTMGRNSPGGGLFVYGFADIERSTVTGNGVRTGAGAGVSAEAEIGLTSSIVAGNFLATFPPVPQDLFSASGITATNSLIGTNAQTLLAEAPLGMPDANGNLIGDPGGQGVIDPWLGPLQNNGGSTATHRLLPASPAIDAGSTTGAMFDQRGDPFVRDRNGRPDMGAYEVQAAPGDFGDGIYDCADIDFVVAQIASGVFDPIVDFTGDGVLNIDDAAAWLAEAGEANLGPGRAYLFGDANLDGFVDGLDFIEWNLNRFAATAAWCSGDFNADGFTDGADFVIWNQNKFQSADVPLTGKPSNRLTPVPRQVLGEQRLPNDRGPIQHVPQAPAWSRSLGSRRLATRLGERIRVNGTDDGRSSMSNSPVALALSFIHKCERDKPPLPR